MGCAYAQFMDGQTACLFHELGNGVYEIFTHKFGQHYRYICMTLKFIRLLLGLSNAIPGTFVQHFARFELTR